MRCVIAAATVLLLVAMPAKGWADAAKDGSANTPDRSEHSTGRTEIPEEKGVKQPQGWTGPTNTTVGGAPAESPQGQSPPGMQSAPEGSSKTIVEPPE